MRLLSLVEQLFFLLEKQKQPMHVGGLFLFDIPSQADDSFVEILVQQMQNSETLPTLPFNQAVHNFTFWRTITELNVDHHLHHVVLEDSQQTDTLLDYVSDEHAKILDKNHPLWECHIIEGINSVTPDMPKKFALYFKIHHSLVDGVAAMRLVEKSLSSSPYEKMTLPLWALLKRNQDSLKAVTPKKRSAIGLIKEQLNTIKPVFSELKDNYATRNDSNHVKTTQAPKSIFNQRISTSRQFTTSSYELIRFESVAKHFKVHTNDVILAVCSGAIRRYLMTINELPSKPLVAFVPISLRNDKSAMGNQISLVLCNLATHLTDMSQRLEVIHNSMLMSKARFKNMNQAEAINYSAVAYAWEGVNLLTNAYPKKQAFNVIISNVPGPSEELYWNGARLSALYPASILFDGQAINITLVTYIDRVDFGIIVCPQTLIGMENLTSLIEEELSAYEMLCETSESSD